MSSGLSFSERSRHSVSLISTFRQRTVPVRQRTVPFSFSLSPSVQSEPSGHSRSSVPKTCSFRKRLNYPCKWSADRRAPAISLDTKGPVNIAGPGKHENANVSVDKGGSFEQKHDRSLLPLPRKRRASSRCRAVSSFEFRARWMSARSSVEHEISNKRGWILATIRKGECVNGIDFWIVLRSVKRERDIPINEIRDSLRRLQPCKYGDSGLFVEFNCERACERGRCFRVIYQIVPSSLQAKMEESEKHRKKRKECTMCLRTGKRVWRREGG